MRKRSRTQAAFYKSVSSRIEGIGHQTNDFSEEDLVGLPAPVKKFFRSCGFLGTPKMSYMKAVFRNVNFILSEKKTIKIDYVQFNFVKKPERFAYIESSLYGIPFEGFDSYGDGIGNMSGTLGKLIPIFNQQGEDMDRSCLITILAECFLAPNVALQDYISWEEIDNNHVKATISYQGISAGGIFTFHENGEVLSFRTADRTSIDMKGTVRKADWTATYSEYINHNGIRQPKILQSIWHYPEGDCMYFNENRSEVAIVYDEAAGLFK